MNTILLNENKLLTAQNKKLRNIINLYQNKYKDIIIIDENEDLITDKKLKEEDNKQVPLIDIIDESSQLCCNLPIKNDMEIVIKETHKLICLEYDTNEHIDETICNLCKSEYVYCKCNKHNEILYYQ